MQPSEIKPDTSLCTILGRNAQSGRSRRYFNKIMKQNSINAAAIALNVADEHFEFTMRNVANSKVDKMIIEQEFWQDAIKYCDWLNDSAKSSNRVDFVETRDGRVEGYCLDDELATIFSSLEFVDEHMRLVAKMMLVAHRWYGVKIDIDEIPLLIEK